MAFDSEPTHDDLALKQRREALRLFVSDIAEVALNLPLPESYVDAERAVRALTLADRAVQTLGPLTLEGTEAHPFPLNSDEEDDAAEGALTDTKHLRLSLRDCADRVMHAATLIAKPETFLEVGRAQRYALSADRLLTQLYVAPKVSKGRSAHFGIEEDPETEAIPPELRDYTPDQLDDLRAEMPDGRLPITLDDWEVLLKNKIARYRPAPTDDAASDVVHGP